MKTILIIAAFLLMCAACSKDGLTKVEKEVMALSTIELQTTFLENINDLNQQARDLSIKVRDEYGHESKQYKEATDFMTQASLENMEKIDLFFKHHGHPHRDTHGEEASEAPWHVIRSQYNYRPKLEDFPMFYKAYKVKDTPGAALAYYLNRMYMMRFGDRIDFGQTFTEEFEIDTLTKALELQSAMAEVDRQLQGVAE